MYYLSLNTLKIDFFNVNFMNNYKNNTIIIDKKLCNKDEQRR